MEAAIVRIGSEHHRQAPSGLVLLMVSRLAWQDLGISAPSRVDRAREPASKQETLQRFWTHCAKPGNFDNGEPIRSVAHPKIFRIRPTDNERAATWYDAASGIVWLLRVLRISEFTNEGALYDHFRFLEQRDQLLPSEPEIAVGRGLHYLEHMIAEISDAFAVCLQDKEDGVWRTVLLHRPDGSRIHIGDVCVTRDEELQSRYLVLRHSFLVTAHLLPAHWREWLLANCFPQDEPVQFDHAPRPPGLTAGNRDIVLRQDLLVEA